MPYSATVESFGALGDGATDDTAAIQAAFDSVPQPAGGTVLLGAKTYRGAGLILRRSNLTVLGVGTSSVLRLTDGSQLSLLACPVSWADSATVDPANVPAGVTLSKFVVDGNRNALVGGGSDFFGLLLLQSDHFTLDRVSFRDWHSDCFTVSHGNIANTTFRAERVRCHSFGRNGLHLGFVDGAVLSMVVCTDGPNPGWALAQAGNGHDLEVEGYDQLHPETGHTPYVRNVVGTDGICEAPVGNTEAGSGIACQPAYGYLSSVSFSGYLIKDHQDSFLITGSPSYDGVNPTVRNISHAGHWCKSDTLLPAGQLAECYGNAADALSALTDVSFTNVVSNRPRDSYGPVVGNARGFTATGNTIITGQYAFYLLNDDSASLTGNSWYGGVGAPQFVKDGGGNTGLTESGNTQLSAGALTFTAPTLSWNVSPGASFSAPTLVTVAPSATSPATTAKVWFFVDGIPEAVATSAPWGFILDPSLYAAGTHAVSARSVDSLANTSAEVSVSVAFAPGSVAYLPLSAGGVYLVIATSSGGSPTPTPTVATPTFSPPQGTYSAAQSVTIATATAGASVRYTADGTTPSGTAGTVYSGPVTVPATETLKAIATKAGYTDSAVATAGYTITGGFDPTRVTSATLTAWFQRGVGFYQDSAATTPATADGAPVSAWKDRVAGHLVTKTGTSPPTLLNGGAPDGGSVVASDKALLQSLAGTYPVGSTFTRYIAYRDLDPYRYDVACDGYNNQTCYVDLRGFRASNGAASALLGVFPDGYWHVHKVAVGGGNLTLDTDGLGGVFSGTASCPSPQDPGGLTLASYDHGASQFGTFWVREVVDFAGTPSPADDAAMWAYMLAGLGVPSALGHRVTVDLGGVPTTFHQKLRVDPGTGAVTLLGHTSDLTSPPYLVTCDASGSAGSVSAATGAGFDFDYDHDAQPSDIIFLTVGANAGKFLRVGYTASTFQFKAVRYNTDLTVDTSFGTSGSYVLPRQVTPSGVGPQDWPYACAEEPVTGKLYAAGLCRTGLDGGGLQTADMMVIRLTPSGALDATYNAAGFGSGNPGVVRLNLTGGLDQVNGIRLDPSTGKLVIAGLCNSAGGGGSPQVYGAARLDTDGTLDTTFNAAGSRPGTLTAIPGQDYRDFSRVFVIDPSSRIYFGWAPSSGSAQGVAQISRYLANGTPDPSWGVAGTALVPFGFLDDMFWGMTLQSDGKLVAAGFMARAMDGPPSGLNGNYVSTAARFNTDGTLDQSFGSHGTALFDFGTVTDFVMFAVLVQPDGKILIAGYDGPLLYTDHHPVVYRLNADGSLDTTFGS